MQFANESCELYSIIVRRNRSRWWTPPRIQFKSANRYVEGRDAVAPGRQLQLQRKDIAAFHSRKVAQERPTKAEEPFIASTQASCGPGRVCQGGAGGHKNDVAWARLMQKQGQDTKHEVFPEELQPSRLVVGGVRDRRRSRLHLLSKLRLLAQI